MNRLYVWRGPGAYRPWMVTDTHWSKRGVAGYARMFWTHADAVGHAQAVALDRVPVAVEVTC